jgi:Na+-translocating ferredoxin:NAD+ oxidoreductase subunit E
MSKLKILTNGFIKENPVFVLVLGTCPTLAVTTSVNNAIGMGLAAAFVIIMSNVMISLLRPVTPNEVRIPVYIVVIATFVSIVDYVLQAYVPALAESLGIFIPLIVVNCIVLGRAEAFAGKNPVFESFLDGVGMGIGFTLALLIISTVREIFGAASFLGHKISFLVGNEVLILVLAPGAFIVFGFIIAIVRALQKK